MGERLERIKRKMNNPRERDTHVRRDRAWLVGEVERQREIIDKLQATGNACHRLVDYLHTRDLELYVHAGSDPAPIPAAVAEAGFEEVRRALKIIQEFPPEARWYLHEREAELSEEREAAESQHERIER